MDEANANSNTLTETEENELEEILAARFKNHDVINSLYELMNLDPDYKRSREGKTVLVYDEKVLGWYGCRSDAMKELSRLGLTRKETMKAVNYTFIENLVAG